MPHLATRLLKQVLLKAGEVLAASWPPWFQPFWGLSFRVAEVVPLIGLIVPLLADPHLPLQQQQLRKELPRNLKMIGQNVLEHVLPLIFRLHVSVSKRNIVQLLDAFAFSVVNWKSGKSENPNLVASNIVLAKTHKK